jgi:rod shape-determining protein MreC
MALPDIRNRSRYLFVAVTVGHILLISSQVSAQSGASLLQETLTTFVVGTQRAAWAVVGGVSAVWNGYAALRGVHADNERLSREVTDLRVQLQKARAAARGTEELRGLLNLRDTLDWTTAPAEVIAVSPTPEFRSITVDRGKDAGIVPNMAVLSQDGVVGRVVTPAAGASTVQLLIDQNAAAAVMVGQTGTQAIALGVGDREGNLRLDYLSAVADIREGDEVLTAGIDGVYPKGLRVGRVSVVERSGLTYRRVLVRPIVDFSSLETVLIVLAPKTPSGGGS